MTFFTSVSIHQIDKRYNSGRKGTEYLGQGAVIV